MEIDHCFLIEMPVKQDFNEAKTNKKMFDLALLI